MEDFIDHLLAVFPQSFLKPALPDRLATFGCFLVDKVGATDFLDTVRGR